MDKETKQQFKKIGKEFENLGGMIKREFDRTDKRFDRVESRLDNLEKGQEDIKLQLDQAAYRFELEDLEKRVRKIELKLNLSKS